MHTDGSALRAEAGAILGVERARRLNAGQWSTVGCQNEILSLVHEESDFFLVVCIMLMDLINQLQLQQHMKGAVLQHGPLKNTSVSSESRCPSLEISVNSSNVNFQQGNVTPEQMVHREGFPSTELEESPDLNGICYLVLLIRRREKNDGAAD